MPRRPWPVLCLGNSVRVFDEATASLARIDDEGAAVCCVEEEDAARGVVDRRDPTIFSQTVHKSTTKAQPCAASRRRTPPGSSWVG